MKENKISEPKPDKRDIANGWAETKEQKQRWAKDGKPSGDSKK